jgi:hypothetical protein
MKRRDFLKSSLLAAGYLPCIRSLLGDQQCQPPVQAPYPPPHAIQQCTAGISSFSFHQAYQERNEWCWAACISMVFGYYDHPVDQQRIVAETWGSVQDMPAQPSDILTDLNKTWKDDDGDEFTSAGDMLSVNPVTAVEDLQADHPLIVGALGHAMVLTALTGNTDLLTQQWGIVAATVRDPWPGRGGKRILSPQEWYSIMFAARIRIV